MNSYTDVYTRSIVGGKALPIEVYARAFFLAAPPWLVTLLRVRNRLVSLFGLKTGNAPKDHERYLHQCQFQRGDELGLFKVLGKSKDEITLGQNDRHLDFSVSLAKKKLNNLTEISMKTDVVFHNDFGKLYFIVIKPFHRFIAPFLLKRLVYKVQHP